MHLRDATAADHAEWLALWEGYVRFYEAQVPPEVTARTWQRILDPVAPLIGRVAVRDGGGLVGITVAVLHEGTWTAQPILYLEDLFVDPAARGGGIGRALMADTVATAKRLGCSRLYWHTHGGNAAARRLYDSFVPADDFVRYRMILADAGAGA